MHFLGYILCNISATTERICDLHSFKDAHERALYEYIWIDTQHGYTCSVIPEKLSHFFELSQKIQHISTMQKAIKAYHSTKIYSVKSSFIICKDIYCSLPTREMISKNVELNALSREWCNMTTKMDLAIIVMDLYVCICTAIGIPSARQRVPYVLLS